MVLDDERIETNKQEFISLLQQITRENCNIEGLIKKLCNSDFFEAPASTTHHLACKGGLAEHCLNVYYNLKHLFLYKQIEVDEDSLIIVGLLHDFSKMNIYEQGVKNKKVYNDIGSKQDELGRFDWVSERSYVRKPEKETFIYGNHEITSEYMIRQFIPLTLEESIAVTHHMGGLGWDSAKDNTSLIFSTYPLAALLHIADMMATFVDEP